MDSISETRLGEVIPILSARIHGLASQLEAEGITIRITAGIRTVAQQDILYAQGRTAPGEVVTNAKGTESNHVMGVAVDVVPMDQDTNAPDWNAQHTSWRRIVNLAPNYGLRDGVSFRDEPHLELVEVPEVPTGEVQQLYVDGGVVAVWAEIEV